MMNKKTILLDCDGVLSDFCQACFDIIEQHTSIKHTHDQVTHWDLFTVLGQPHLKNEMKRLAGAGGWCAEFMTYPGAQEAVARLDNEHELVIVTSPMSVSSWAHERELWLKKHFNIPKGRIVQTEGKKYVWGDVFIDDADDNCISWAKRWPDSLSLLWDAPYNRSVDLTGTGVVRVHSWDEIFSLIDRQEAA